MSLTREEFAQAAKGFLEARGEARPIRYDAAFDRLVVGSEKGPTSFIALGHAFAEYLPAPELERTRVMARRFWATIQPVNAPTPESLGPYLLPQLRDRAWFSALRRRIELELGSDEALIQDLMLPFSELSPDVAVHLAVELPTSVMELGTDRLHAWGKTFDELYQLAVANLRERSTRDFEEPEPGVFVSPYHDALDATRMVLVDRVKALEVKGTPVALAPTHDVLMIAGDEDEAGLTTIATWAEEALLEPRAHTAYAFRLEGDVWKTWLPERGHPAWEKLRLLQLQSLAAAYARQKDVLDALLETNGHDIFVANVRAFKSQDGNIFTACAWTEGIEALLPMTDRLDFVKLPPDGDTRNAQIWSTRWDIAQKTVGQLMTETGDVPTRYRVTGFPSDAQLEEMAQSAQGTP